MENLMTRIRLPLFWTLLVVTLVACGGRSYVNVVYQLPEAYKGFPDQPVYLEVTDQRAETDIFTPDAKRAFRHFTGLFSLEVVGADGSSQMAGAYDLAGLFEEALRERFRRQGVTLLKRPQADADRLLVSVENFRIDLKQHKWFADVGYAVALHKPSGTVLKEKIRGNAERVKLMGKRDIEKVIGEIFSDSVNRLNLKRLLDPTRS
jgi:nucleoside 2-deoxyribosyltransferase